MSVLLYNHADSNLAYMNTDLEEVVLVTLTGHVETLSIICTTSMVICSQEKSMLCINREKVICYKLEFGK